MTSLRLILASLLHHRRIHVAVALGVMAATSVLTGALLVGDSMRGSLRHLTLDRLGPVDEVLVGQRFFRAELAKELTESPDFKNDFSQALPAIMLQGTLENQSQKKHPRASHVNVLAVDERFWELVQASLPAGARTAMPQPGEIVVNQLLADALHSQPIKDDSQPDEVILRLPGASLIPADSPLGKKTDTIRSQRLKVKGIVPAEGLGRFSLHPSQQSPLVAFANLSGVQTALKQADRANAIFVTGYDSQADPAPEAYERLTKQFKPQLDDYGLLIQEIHRDGNDYFNLTSDRMLLERPVEEAAMRAFAMDGVQPTLTYLANYIEAGDGKAKIPYSTITALVPAAEPPLGPLLTTDGQQLGAIADDEIVLNDWTTNDMAQQGVKVKIGDPIQITYFLPESTHGKIEEATRTLKLKAIVKLAGAAADRNFTPELKGITDSESIANWTPPFPYFPERVRITPPHAQDDTYWRKYKATPKAFVSLTTGRKLWGSRFGQTTAIRIPAQPGMTTQSLGGRLKLDPAALGLDFMPVKSQGLMASSGTTPFNLLFLGFSSFIMVAAMMLVMILFRLGIDQRASEIGIELAVGVSRRRVRRMLLLEGLVVALGGGLLGVLGGLGYAWLMLTGLQTWWLAAIVTPFLHLYVSGASLALGFGCGVLFSLATIAWALRQMRHVSNRQLLAGQATAPMDVAGRWPRKTFIAGCLLLLAAVGLGIAATRLGGESQAGAFFGAGGMVLAGGLSLVWVALRVPRRGAAIAVGGAALARLAIRNSARNPGRSTLTLGLMSAACFLIVAVSAFHLDDAGGEPRKNSGDGGFATLAETDQPLHYELETDAGRRELNLDPADPVLASAQIFNVRLQSGDDASCLNLYQPRQPRVLGLSQRLIERGGFEWAGSAAKTEAERANPWRLLEPSAAGGEDDPIPAVLDQNTAMYSLHLWEGVGETFELNDGRGRKVRLQIVGLLSNSIFQGDVLVSEANFLKLYPDVSGFRLFLIDAPPQRVAAVNDLLSDRLGDYGFNTTSTAQRLAELMAVQNTYLSTFQSLGGLGLLLGTFGLAVVQLRSVLERRGELALMRATGFRRARVATMVMLENAALLIGGLSIGVLAALVAILPQIFSGRATLPWQSLALTLGLVLVVGLIAGLAAVRATLKAPLLSALRGE